MKIVVCDDDALVYEQMKNIIASYSIVKNENLELTFYQTVEELLHAKHKYDILFLDIRFNNCDIGIDVAKKLRKAGNTSLIILLTSLHGDTLLPHSASVTFPPRAGRICQPIHLNESLSRAAFTAAIPLNDCSLKGDALELGHLEGDISGSGGEIAVVVAAAIPLTLLITLIPGSLGQLVGLRLQQFVERLLYTASYEFFELPLDYFLV